MTFIKDQFLLTTKTAQRLFQEAASREPIFDFYSHISPAQVAENLHFANPAELFLAQVEGRTKLMRANGVDERFFADDAEPFEKFLAFAKTMARALRHPLYDATHLELKRLFGIDWLLQEKTARPIWDAVQAKLKSPDATPRGLLRKFRVVVQCIVTDATASLEPFRAVQAERGGLRLIPNLSADSAINSQADFGLWCDRLAEATGHATTTWVDFQQAVRQRHDEFHALGCRIADYALAQVPAEMGLDPEALFRKVRAGSSLPAEARGQFDGAMFRFFTTLQTELGWTLHLHLGAAENGFNDLPQANALAAFLRAQHTSRMLIDVRNPLALPAVGRVLAADPSRQRQLDLSDWEGGASGLEQRLQAVSTFGLLGRNVGVSSGASSLPELVRHEYFRRVLCAVVGRDFEAGLIPGDWDLAARTVRDICYRNATRFFGIDTQIG